MKAYINILLGLLLCFSAAFAEGGKCSHSYTVYSDFNYYDNTDIDIEDGTVIITHKGRDKTVVEITEKYKLSVDGKRIELNSEQEELVKQYYHLVIELHEQAAEVGREGAKIGLEGARLGTKAIKNVLKMFLTDYDSDDLEREMEKEAAKIEAKADALEEQAEEIEDLAEELETVAEELEEKIPELDNIIWY